MSYFVGRRKNHCEVKTLQISDEEIQRRRGGFAYDGIVYAKLSNGFFNKFECGYRTAMKQIKSKETDGLVYFVIEWDDMSVGYDQEYKREMVSYCRDQNMHAVYIHTKSACGVIDGYAIHGSAVASGIRARPCAAPAAPRDVGWVTPHCCPN